MNKDPTFKLTFTPERMAEVIQAGIHSQGFEIDMKLQACVQIEETVRPQGREQIPTDVYVLSFSYQKEQEA